MNPPARRYGASSQRSGSDSVSRSPALKAEDLEYIRLLLREEAAIDLEHDKGYFVEARLDVLATREGFPSSSELMAGLKLGKHDGLRLKAVEAMTQNETSFFRDARPFEELRRSILPDLIARRAEHRRLKIWSAACSSGQEPYSLALMLLEDFPELGDWDVSILASDLSTEMIDRARAGRYSQVEVNRGLPAALLIEHFRRDGLEWMIEEPVRRSVEFRTINLAGQWPTMAGLDLIVLRNVLIYLAIDGRKDILAKAAGALATDGYLWLGTAETTINIDDRFERVEPECGSIYRLRRPLKH
jgi:chemotaxis protein methyltransferase CheR